MQEAAGPASLLDGGVSHDDEYVLVGTSCHNLLVLMTFVLPIHIHVYKIGK